MICISKLADVVRSESGVRAYARRHQLRQLGDIRRDAPRFILREQLGRRSAARLFLEIGIGELLPGGGPLR
jgi:hypothetical protein